jgi:hypothetical protein
VLAGTANDVLNHPSWPGATVSVVSRASRVLAGQSAVRHCHHASVSSGSDVPSITLAPGTSRYQVLVPVFR